uniref:Uncharacterized protein n=1 Tax=Setaria viridis TaxID=4556 RepID=A0A4U6WGC7_SETVI|nr:hypothetical protein SEVIR_1G016850v2 [Setaria viridis]
MTVLLDEKICTRKYCYSISGTVQRVLGKFVIGGTKEQSRVKQRRYDTKFTVNRNKLSREAMFNCLLAMRKCVPVIISRFHSLHVSCRISRYFTRRRHNKGVVQAYVAPKLAAQMDQVWTVTQSVGCGHVERRLPSKNQRLHFIFSWSQIPGQVSAGFS